MKASARQQRKDESVLDAVIRLFLLSGKAVSSAQVAKEYPKLGASATIRQSFSRLNERDLLQQSVANRGRRPTSSALRQFINQGIRPRLRPWDRTHLNQAVSEFEGSFQRSLARAVSQLTGQLVAFKSPIFGLRRLKEIGIVRLRPHYFSVIFVGTRGSVHQITLECPFDLRGDELQRVQNLLNAKLGERSLAEVRDVIAREYATHLHRAESWLQKAWSLGRDAMPQAESTLVIEGTENLLRRAEAEDVSSLRHLIESVHDRSSLLSLIEELGTQHEIQVLWPSENENLLVCVGRPVSDSVSVGIFGVGAMDFERLVPMVDFAAQLLSRHELDE